MQQAIDILDEMIGQNRYGGTTDYSIDAEKWLIEARSRIQILGDGWIPVTERLPENEKYVLGTYINSYQKSRVIRCFYTRKFQTEITENLDDDYGDYCEEKDAVFFPEGWYESNETDETYYEPDGQITHWQPLPLPPKQ